MKLRNLILTFTVAVSAFMASAATTLEKGRWSITNSDDNSLTITHNGAEFLNGVYASATYRIENSSKTGEINTSTMSPTSVTIVDSQDEIGTGKIFTRVYTDGTVNFTHTITAYDKVQYLVAQVTLTPVNSNDVVASNNIVAFATKTRSNPFDTSSVRMIWVPFDNDGHGRYQVKDLNTEMVSHEVSCIYHASTKKGVVLGSIDHDKWKSGIKIKGAYNRYIDKIELLSGYTSDLTRDYDWTTNKAIPHGYVKGKEVKSARYLVGLFEDWRVGLESFGEACAAVVPPAPWDGGNPMGWSTWGVMQDHVNTPAVTETAQWIKSNLFDLGFHDKNDQTVISLDSFCEDWGMTSAEISKLGNKVFSEGTYREGIVKKEGLNMRLGMYGGMVIWDWSFGSQVGGTGTGNIPSYTWGDALLTYQGRPHYLFQNGQYCAIDPTHPAFYYNMEYTLSRWAAMNVKYIKLDFINAGICEGDSWYNPEITTGKMAYNYGMQIIYELATKYDMYILESMAPLFPYRWAHGRRSCCDRFSEIGESEYVMNAMTWGWWTDRIYTVNDPDHLVLHKDGHRKGETEGENRARVTTGVCTGAFLIGDSFSDKCVYTNDNGHTKGDVVAYPEESKVRALKMFGNAEINAYVRENTGSFRPLYGDKYSSSQQAAYVFMRDTPDYVYVAAFNYNKYSMRNEVITFESLGLETSNVKEIKELWTGEMITPSNTSFSCQIPAADARIYRIAKVLSGVGDIAIDEEINNSISAAIAGNECVVACAKEISSVQVYDLNSRIVAQASDVHHVQAVFDINVHPGVYIIEARMEDGTSLTTKVVSK